MISASLHIKKRLLNFKHGYLIYVCNRVILAGKNRLTLFARMGEFVLVPKFAAKMTLHIFCDISWS